MAVGEKIKHQNLLCKECSYCLYTIGADGACPECGATVRDSIRWQACRRRQANGHLVASGTTTGVIVFFGLVLLSIEYLGKGDNWAAFVSILSTAGLTLSPAAAFYARLALKSDVRQVIQAKFIFWSNVGFACLSAIWVLVVLLSFVLKT